jgi:hypothetical protein
MGIKQDIAALEQQYKTEVDSRARSTIAAQLKKLKAQMADQASVTESEDKMLRLKRLSGIITESQVLEFKANRDLK